MAALTWLFVGIPDYSYRGLLHLASNAAISGSLSAVQDGMGNATGLELSTSTLKYTGILNLASKTASTLIYVDSSKDVQSLANGTGWLHNDGAGVLTYSTPTKADVGLSNVENTALSTWAGTSNITTLGTIATGVWNATKISEIYGGTNQNSYTTGDVLYASAANTLSKLGIGTAGQILTVAGGVPTWAAAPAGMTIGGSITSATAGSILYAGAAGVLAQDNSKLYYDYTNSRLSIGSATSPESRMNVYYNQTGVTQADANGLLLGNQTPTTNTVGQTATVSAPLITQTNYWETTGSATRDVRFRWDALGVTGASTLGILHGYYQLSANTKAGGYLTLLKIDDLGGTTLNLLPSTGDNSSEFNIWGNPNAAGTFPSIYGRVRIFMDRYGSTSIKLITGSTGDTLHLSANNSDCNIGSVNLLSFGTYNNQNIQMGNISSQNMIYLKNSNGRLGFFTSAPIGLIDARIGSGTAYFSYDASNYMGIAVDSGGVASFTLNGGGTPLFGFTKDIAITTVGKGLQIKEGSNAKMGVATLSGGSVTVSTTAITASSRVFITAQTQSGWSALPGYAVRNKTAGTSFDINSTDSGDTSTIAWMIIEAA